MQPVLGTHSISGGLLDSHATVAAGDLVINNDIATVAKQALAINSDLFEYPFDDDSLECLGSPYLVSDPRTTNDLGESASVQPTSTDSSDLFDDVFDMPIDSLGLPLAPKPEAITDGAYVYNTSLGEWSKEAKQWFYEQWKTDNEVDRGEVSKSLLAFDVVCDRIQVSKYFSSYFKGKEDIQTNFIEKSFVPRKAKVLSTPLPNSRLADWSREAKQWFYEQWKTDNKVDRGEVSKGLLAFGVVCDRIQVSKYFSLYFNRKADIQTNFIEKSFDARKAKVSASSDLVLPPTKKLRETV